GSKDPVWGAAPKGRKWFRPGTRGKTSRSTSLKTTTAAKTPKVCVRSGDLIPPFESRCGRATAVPRTPTMRHPYHRCCRTAECKKEARASRTNVQMVHAQHFPPLNAEAPARRTVSGAFARV